MDESDLIRVRRAVSGYFRAAAGLGGAALLMRHAACLARDEAPAELDEDDVPDRDFFLDRATMYHEKALLMSESATALLSHADRWFAELEADKGDVDEVLEVFARSIEVGSEACAEVADALEGASFAGLDRYPELLDELRGSVQFLSMESAVFAALVARQLEYDEDEEMPDEEVEEEPELLTPASPAELSVSGAKAPPRFDRRVPDLLLDALSPGGAFGWLTALARCPIEPGAPALDLGLRALPKTRDAGHATLYLGTTQVLGLHLAPDGRFRLTPHRRGGLFAAVDPPFDPEWSLWQSLAQLADAAPEIGRHVRAAVNAAPKGRQVEGLYQAALAKPTDHGFVLVDREIQLVFDSDVNRRTWKDEWRVPLIKAQRTLGSEHPWAAKAEPPGHKLDALAIAEDGRLLAIEVKPGAATKGLCWTPVQVAMYMRMLQAWIGPDHEYARDVLEGMARQRAVLGLVGDAIPPVRLPIDVVPVIAVGKPMTRRHEAPERFALVREALQAAGEPLTGLQLWAIEESGELSVTNATDLDERFR